VQTGDWVHFDAKFNICEVASLFEGTVFFPDFADSRYRNTGETAEPPGRLVLHGAIKHLVGSAREHISDEVLRVQSASEWPTRLLMYGPAIDLSSRINRMQHFSPLSPDMPMVFDRSGFPPDFPALLYAGPIGGLRMLVKQLDKTLPPSTYSSMAGYARVTAMDKAASNQPRIIAATPLFVERVSGTRSSVTW